MCRGGHSSHKHPLQRSERLRHAAGIVKHDLFTPGGVLRYSLLLPRCPTTIDQRRPLRDAKLQTFEGEIATVRVHRADPADVVSVHRVCRRLEEDVVRSVREERLEVVCLLASTSSIAVGSRRQVSQEKTSRPPISSRAVLCRRPTCVG